MSFTHEQIEQPADDMVERSPIGDVPDTRSVEGSDTATRETTVRESEQTSRQREEQRGANQEGTAMPTPSFGGLSPAEAGRRSAAKRAEARKQAAEKAGRDERTEIIAHMRRLATTGTGTTAVQAARYLDEVARQDAQWVIDQGLLALLTREQRACIEAHLRGEAVSHAQAIEAWATETPAKQDDPQRT
jgi:hypothetical protein